MTELLIFPFNGNGLEALDCLGNNFDLLGFIDDTKEKQGKHRLGFEVFSREAIERYSEAKILVVPGSSTSFQDRRRIIEGLHIPTNRLATVIHPKATISSLATIGHNVLIMAGTVITSNGIIGNHICILPNTVIHHDVIIGDYTLIGSNVCIAGHTIIESNCYIGSRSSIINNVVIGRCTLVGMGTNVIKSLPENSKVVGNPARQIA